MVPRPRTKELADALRGGASSLLSVTGTSATCALLVLGAPTAWANPSAPVVQSGGATFSSSGATYTINQSSQHAIIHWGAFGNAAGETIRFNQPNASSAVLNRVTGGNPSAILGNLDANGRVFVINPNGVLVGADAIIRTNGFVASTHDVTDAAFLADGDLLFSGSSTAEVTNLGSITAAEGDVVLIAHTVRNTGSLRAPNGVVALGAGTEVWLRPTAADRIFVQSGSATATAARGVDNTGVVEAAQAELKAAGGNVYSLAVNTGGAVRATGIATRGGRVVITAAGDGEIAVGGELSARDFGGDGGRVELSAQTISATTGASVETGELSLARARAFNFGAAPVTADLVRYGSFGGGAFSTFNLDNPGNSIARVVMNDGEGTIGPTFASGFRLFSNRSLTLGDASAGYAGVFNFIGEGVVSIIAAGDLRLEGEYVHITARDTTATLASTGGQFVNATTVSTPLDREGSGRFRVYSTSSGVHGGTAFDDGGLVDSGFTLRHGVSLGSDPHAADAGSYFYFSNRLLTISADDAARVYGDANPVFAVNYSGFAPGDTSALVTGLDFTAPGILAEAGVYADAITPFGATAAGYDIVFESGTLTVDRASLTVVADSDSRTYGSANAALNAHADGLKNGETLASLFTPTLATGALASDGVGSYAITVSGPSQTANYDVAYVNGQLDITPAALLVTAANATRVYGDANPVFALGSAGGFVNGDTAALLAGLIFTTPATTASGVGSYAINPSLPAALANYDVSFAPGSLAITPADLFIQINGATRVYGSANPTFSGTVLSGLRNNDTFDFSALGVSTTATLASGVGTYAITGASGPVGNYQPVLVGSATLAITPATLTLTAADAARVWSDANPVFGYTLSGLVNGDPTPTAISVGFNTAAHVASNVGAYAITPSGGVATSDPNYIIGAFAPGTLTINPLQITVTADAFSRVYGDFNPLGFTGTYVTNSATASSGIVGDGGAVFASGAAIVRLISPTTAASNVGSYGFNLTASGDAVAAGNIIATLAPDSGKLSITPASLVVTPYLSLTASTHSPLDFTASNRLGPITQVTADHKPTGVEYLVTTYKQEAANNSGGVTFVKVVSTPLGADPITGTNPDGTVRMQVLNTRYVSSDGVTYVRDTRPHADNSEGTITFNPNAARAVTIADPSPAMGLIAAGLKNNDGLNFTYTTPAMAAANATYSLGEPIIDAGPNYTVTVADADLSFRLDPLRLRLVLPDITVPANFFVPSGADMGFNIAGDFTLADFTRIYLGQIRILNRPTDAQFAAAAQGTTVTTSLGANPPPPSPVATASPATIFVSSSTLTLVGADGSATSAPTVPAVGTTEIERIAGFRLGNPDFIADEIARISSLIKRGVPEKTGNSPAELKNFYPVTPTIGFNNPYLTTGVEYPLTYKTILPSGALVKTPKTWSDILVGPALPPPLPPDSQSAAGGIAAAESALKNLRSQTYGSLEDEIASIDVGSISSVERLLWREFPDLYIQIPDRGANVFGLTGASDEFLGKALWLWAVSRGMPVSRGGATAGDIAIWYQLAATNQQFKAEVAGFLAMQMSDILARQAGHLFDPAKTPPLTASEAAFLADFNDFIAERQAIAFNRAAAAQESWINERTAVAMSNVQGTNGSMLSLYNTGHIGEKKAPPPEEFRKAAANWVPDVNPDDAAFQTVLRTLGLTDERLVENQSTHSSGQSDSGLTTRSSTTVGASVGNEFIQQGHQFVDDGIIEGILNGLPKPKPAVPVSTRILDAVFPHTRSATLGTLASGILMGASLVTEALLGVLQDEIDAARFTEKMNDLRGKVSTKPKSAMDILTHNPLVNKGDVIGLNDTSPREAQNQLESRGYSDAGMAALMAMFTTMVCGDVNRQSVDLGQHYGGSDTTTRFNTQL